jgi:hypothetical protein
VRHRVVEVHEEGPRIFVVDERRRFAREEIVDVIVFQVCVDPLRVPPEIIGKLPMRVPVIEKSERVVESLAIGLPGRPRLAEPPLADHRRSISRAFQHFRNRHVFGRQRRVAAGGDVSVSANRGVSRVPAGHQGRA